MDETDKPDPVLQQVPLIKNPKFQPPKPVTLNTNYSKLLPNLAHTVKPPKLNLTKPDLDQWIEEIDQMKEKYDNGSETTQKSVSTYQTWLEQAKLKVAPGFNSAVMTPQRHTNGTRASGSDTKENSGTSDTNELDQVFGRTKLDD